MTDDSNNMKTKLLNLKVDVIGGLGDLTKQEEVALSQYFQSKKLKLLSGKKSKTKG